MIEIKFNKTRYILGLQWVECTDDPQLTIESLADRAQDRRLDYVKLTANDKIIVGYTSAPIDRKKGERPYSLAATLARRKENAAYVLKVDDNVYWFCAIADGLVITSTDRTMSIQEINELVNDLQAVIGHVYVQETIPDLIAPVAGKSIDEILRGLRPVPIALYQEKERGALLQIAKGLGAFAASLLVLWYFVLREEFERGEIQALKTPEQIRAEYIVAVRNEMGTILGDHRSIRLWFEVIDRVPTVAYTMGLSSITCRGVAGCVSVYVKRGSDVPSSGRLLDATLDVSGHRVAQNVAVAPRPIMLTDDEIVEGPRVPSAQMAPGEIVGRLPAVAPTLAVATEYQVRTFGSTIPMERKPPGAVPIRMEVLNISVSRGWDKNALARIDQWLNTAGFRLQEMELFWDNDGNAVTNGRARMVYARLL